MASMATGQGELVEKSYAGDRRNLDSEIGHFVISNMRKKGWSRAILNLNLDDEPSNFVSRASVVLQEIE